MARFGNPLATPSQLLNRSSLWALPQDLQEVVFIATQSLTQAAGLQLELPQSVTSQANVILARYWLIDSPMAHEFSDVSAAAIYLVSKMGSHPRSPRDVSNVYTHLLSPQSILLRPCDRLPEPPAEEDPRIYYQTESDYFTFHNRLLTLEARILYALSFDTHVSLPHPLTITYLQTLEFLDMSDQHAVSQRAVQHLNTALLSPQMLYLTHQPNELATAAVYCAARDLGAKMPERPWWEVFDVDREELGFLMVGIRSVDRIVAARREDMPWLATGMVTRDRIENELKKRSLQAGNRTRQGNEEDEVMRMMDTNYSSRG